MCPRGQGCPRGLHLCHFYLFYWWNSFRSSIDVLFDLQLLLRQYKKMPECSFCVISDMTVIAFKQRKL